jgi:hypothetical protein
MKLIFISRTKAGAEYFKGMVGELDEQGGTFKCSCEEPYTIESDTPMLAGKPKPDKIKAVALKIGYRQAFKHEGLKNKDFKVKFEND